MTFEQRRAADFRRYEQNRADKLTLALADWRVVRDRYAHVPAVTAALDIHQPKDHGPFDGIGCAHPVSGGEADPEEWPCSTFVAIKEA